jgi:hypothetical protein
MNGIDLIEVERGRQIAVEGYTPEHDDQHDKGELAEAALAYLSSTVTAIVPQLNAELPPPPFWPFAKKAWKPSADKVRCLVKAGALIAAEIDRRQRIKTPETKTE